MSVLLNLFFAWFLWKVGSAHLDDKEDGSRLLGWLGIAVSAMNFASAMATIF